MKVIEQVGIDVVIQHLNNTGSSLWNKREHVYGKRPQDYTAFRVKLDADDYERFILWEGNATHSFDNVSCRLTDMLKDKVLRLERVQDFIQGKTNESVPPADLRTTPNLEPVMVTDAFDSPILYLIDGNNRVMAQHFSGKGFHDAVAYVCVNPKVMDIEEGIPKRYRAERKLRSPKP